MPASADQRRRSRNHSPGCLPRSPQDEELDLPAFRAEIQYQLSLNGVRGLTIGGSTGEGHALEADELGTLVKVAVEEVRGRIPIIAGIITTTTRRAVRYAKAAREAGRGR